MDETNDTRDQLDTDWLPDTPGKEMHVWYRLECLKDWTKDLREELFEQEGPKFSGRYKAGQWIEKKSDEGRELWQESDRYQVFSEIVDQCVEHGFTVPEPPSDHLPYRKESENPWIEYAPTFEETKLQRLHDTTEKMQKAFGFPQSEIVNYVLTGIEPFYYRATIQSPSWRITAPNEETFTRREIQINLRSPLPGQDEWRNLLKRIKKRMGTFRHNPPNEKHLRVKNFVVEQGGPPDPEGNKVFWESALEKWNERHDDDQLSKWLHLYQRWRRARQKLEEPLDGTTEDMFKKEWSE